MPSIFKKGQGASVKGQRGPEEAIGDEAWGNTARLCQALKPSGKILASFSE